MTTNTGKSRIGADILKLLYSNHKVTILKNPNELSVQFHGPKGTPYEGGIWSVSVYIPEHYPFKSPSIGFMNRVFHPNIDESSGTVCLDAINETWTPLYTLVNIFEIFLPQLFKYPNPKDPLNGEAAALFLHDPTEYQKIVIEYVRRYATDERNVEEKSHKSDGSASELSDFEPDDQ